MKTFTYFVALFFIAISISFSQAPNTISWQGILQDSEGNNLTGNHNLTLKLYEVATGGTAAWTETHNAVSVENGLVNLALGSVTSPNISFDKQYWLEITVGEGTPLPRIKLSSVPYSLYSKKTSGIIENDSIVLKDSLGITRMVFNPNSGTFKMMNNDTVWYEMSVNSPLRIHRSDAFAGVSVFEYTQNGKKIVEHRNNMSNIITYKKEESLDPETHDNTTTEYRYDLDGNLLSTEENIYYNATGTTYNEVSIMNSEGNIQKIYKEWQYSIGATWPNTPGTINREVWENGALISKTSSNPNSNSNVIVSPEYGEEYSAKTEQNTEGTSLKHSTLNQFYNQLRNSGSLGGYKIGVGSDNSDVSAGFTFDQFGAVHVNPTNNNPFFVQGNLSTVGNSYTNGNQTITGNLNVSGTKNFMIEHPDDPENKYLFHAAIESDQVLNQYSGNVVTNSEGMAIVKLPDYVEKINKNFRYQLTVIGDFAQAIILKKIANSQFTIKTDKPNIEVSWLIIGERNDIYMQENPFVPVREKETENKVKLLYKK
ncbi:MAG TPA: hypothetical protein PKY56_01315 [Candidatus Kapabacteria bacterium]|nr:hypothetical protein [Candidatus Kapabacteria bacterium]HPO62844.1 hypothetical protein [Candidatus Kapabacteria bacterium]